MPLRMTDASTTVLAHSDSSSYSLRYQSWLFFSGQTNYTAALPSDVVDSLFPYTGCSPAGFVASLNRKIISFSASRYSYSNHRLVRDFVRDFSQLLEESHEALTVSEEFDLHLYLTAMCLAYLDDFVLSERSPYPVSGQWLTRLQNLEMIDRLTVLVNHNKLPLSLTDEANAFTKALYAQGEKSNSRWRAHITDEGFLLSVYEIGLREARRQVSFLSKFSMPGDSEKKLQLVADWFTESQVGHD